MLYFVNTLGAAIGALLTVWLVFTLLGLGGSLRLAIVLNLVIGLLGLAVGKDNHMFFTRRDLI